MTDEGEVIENPLMRFGYEDPENLGRFRLKPPSNYANQDKILKFRIRRIPSNSTVILKAQFIYALGWFNLIYGLYVTYLYLID